MLQYRRRNTIEPQTEQKNSNATPLLSYCNWSYSSDYHIDIDTLKNILYSFNHEYIPYYLRIFNETPRQVVESFLEQYKISKSSLDSIYNKLLDNGFKVKYDINILSEDILGLKQNNIRALIKK